MNRHQVQAEVSAVNRRRLALAQTLLAESIRDALACGEHGTIGVRIPVHAGKLGQVRRIHEVVADDNDGQ